MKLYTRDQMLEAFTYGKTLKGFDHIGDMIDSLGAIELPTNEEIEKESLKTDFDETFRNGAKWMKEQILNQNK